MAKTDRTLRLVAALLPVALALAPAAVRAEGDVTVGGYLDSAPVVDLGLSTDEAPALTTSLGRLALIDGERGTTLRYFTPRLSGFQLGLGYTSEAFSLREPNVPVGRVAGESGAGGGGSLAVGGGLSLSAIELGLPAAQGGRDAGLVTAGVGYEFGGINTSVTYGFARPTPDEELNLLALNADVSVAPGVAVTGGLAYTEQERSGDQTAAGVLGLRLNF